MDPARDTVLVCKEAFVGVGGVVVFCHGGGSVRKAEGWVREEEVMGGGMRRCAVK